MVGFVHFMSVMIEPFTLDHWRGILWIWQGDKKLVICIIKLLILMILEMSRNIHPTNTWSSEELKELYIEIFIETYPQTFTPLFISGQIGSGIKSFIFDNQAIHYFDISDLSIQNPNDSMDVCLAILHKIIELTYPESDLSSIDNLIESTYVFGFTSIKFGFFTLKFVIYNGSDKRRWR